MKLGAVVTRGAWVFLAVAAACSSDDDDSTGDVKCGAGTVLQDGECVVDSEGSPNGGTNGQAGSMDEAGSTSKGGSAGTANAGATNGGAEPEAMGGTAGDAGMGGDGSQPQPEPEVAPTRWFVFAHEKGVFAYDTTKFPATDGLLTLSSKPQRPYYYGVIWSPNGKSVLFGDAGTFYVTELTDTASTPRLVFSNPSLPFNFLAPYAWSADSSSLLVISGNNTSVLDPSKAAPTLHPISSSLKEYRWAPSGNRLFYVDDSGSHVVQVDHGTPGTPVDVDPGASLWAPNGYQLAGIKDGEVTLTTLNGNTASLQVLTSLNPPVDPVEPGTGGAGGEGGSWSLPQPPAVTAYLIGFNRDGSKLAFNTYDGVTSRPHLISMKPTPSAPTSVTTGAPADASSSCSSWSPDGTLLLCSWSKIGAGSWFATNDSGGAPVTVLDTPYNNNWRWSPNPAKHQLFTIDGENDQLIVVDLATPNFAQTIYNGTPLYSISPTGGLVSYVVEPKVYVVNLASPQTPPAEIAAFSLFSDTPVATWSPDGKFLSVTDEYHQLRLVRVDGANLSTPLPLQGGSKDPIYGAWQP